MPKDKPRRFRLVKGDGNPGGDDSRPLYCRQCAFDGLPRSAQFIEAILGAREKDGQLTGEGQPALYCLHCLARGKVTRIL